ncbi:MAG: L-seryl-tRNA(Sec) selenium transferase [Planctomycetes bacterium]|nr:L-seryl-tRNA(Sec) selenium transferase [Planctomycetota bacterium]
MPRTDSERTSALRHLPPIDQILRDPRVATLPRAVLARQARRWLHELREQVLAGELDAEAVKSRCDGEAAAGELSRRCELAQRPRHERVINATGVVLHTGIGRAALGQRAIDAITAIAGFGIVEVDPVSGERDQRELGIAALLHDVLGADGGLVVNNNAAATTLMLTALCEGREVVISRGELVEIGGGFRVPDVMRRAGCHMVEVGATNKTHLRDYEDATNERTVAWLKVHPSNFRIEGFAGVPTVQELAAKAGELLVLDDLGSGLLWNEPLAGLEDEPRVQDSMQGGAHVTCFSGDKLLGGPQCGILVGRKDLIARCRAHPLYRALRCDKLTLAALEATLAIYRDGDPLREIPTLRMLAAPAAELRARSEELCALLGRPDATVVDSESFAGAGANPARPLSSHAVAFPGGQVENDRLRAARPHAIFARVADGRVLLDARTLLPEDLGPVAAAVRSALS